MFIIFLNIDVDVDQVHLWRKAKAETKHGVIAEHDDG